MARKAARDYTTREADLQEQDLPYLEKVRRCYQDLALVRDDWSIVRGLNDDGSLRTIDEVGNEILTMALSHIQTTVSPST